MHIDQIINKAIKKNRRAQNELYAHYGHVWYSICLRYHKNSEEAKDALQNALIKIYSKIKQFDKSKGDFKSWSCKIVVNENLMLIRKNKNFLREFDDTYDESILDSEETAIDILSAAELTKMVQQLPDGYRTIFNLYVIEGYSHEEIATMLNISKGTSKSQLFKAKKLLKRKLEVLI
jgi:RNA polymerase sigma-70 factor (ECF subfamily)